jgi:hypothetical protein
MTIEWLKYNVTPESQKTFLKMDTEINLVICWHSKADWKAIPESLLQETDKKFIEAVGRFELLGVLEYAIL